MDTFIMDNFAHLCDNVNVCDFKGTELENYY
jgi:hypothetical protein